MLTLRDRRFVRYGMLYLRAARAWNKDSPVKVGKLQLVRHFVRWYRSFNQDTNASLNDQPWLPFIAIDWLIRHHKSDWSVFEWGMGGSTIFFASRVQSLISIEHQRSWDDIVRKAVGSRRLTNWNGVLIEAERRADEENSDPTDWNSFVSSSSDCVGLTLRKYVEAIDLYPNYSFDLVAIDGRARPACFKHALPKVKMGGFILWDDTDRGCYASALRSTPTGFRVVHIAGPCPKSKAFSQTSLIQRIASTTFDQG